MIYLLLIEAVTAGPCLGEEKIEERGVMSLLIV